jgi:hypothetical protein
MKVYLYNLTMSKEWSEVDPSVRSLLNSHVKQIIDGVGGFMCVGYGVTNNCSDKAIGVHFKIQTILEPTPAELAAFDAILVSLKSAYPAVGVTADFKCSCSEDSEI